MLRWAGILSCLAIQLGWWLLRYSTLAGCWTLLNNFCWLRYSTAAIENHIWIWKEPGSMRNPIDRRSPGSKKETCFHPRREDSGEEPIPTNKGAWLMSATNLKRPPYLMLLTASRPLMIRNEHRSQRQRTEVQNKERRHSMAKNPLPLVGY